MSPGAGDVMFRRADGGDRDLLLEWANEAATRAASFRQAPIDPETHARWFAARLSSPDAGIWIGEMDGRPIGQVRVERIDGPRGEISISLAPEARGQRLARPLLLAGIAEADRVLKINTFVAAVRHGNAASLALFRGSGFSEETEGQRDGVPCTILVRGSEVAGAAAYASRGLSRKPRPNVLITSASRKVPLVRAFTTATAMLGGRVIAADVNPLAAALYEAHDARIVPHSDDPDFVDALIELCAIEAIGLVVPTRDDELPVLARARERFAAEGTLVLVSPPQAVDSCQDKALFADVVAAAELDTPRAFARWNEVAFPAFVKPRWGKGGAGISRVPHAGALAAALEKAGPDAIIQELVEAPEYTIDTFLDLDGRAITCVPRERITVVDGESVVSRTVHDPMLVDATLRLCAAIGLVGQVTVQAFRTPDRILFIEVNPRYGGAASLSIAAGAPTPALAIRLARGDRLVPQLYAYDVGMIMLRSATDRFLHDSNLVRSDAIADAASAPAVAVTGGQMTQADATPEAGIRWKAVLFDLDDTLYPERQFVEGGFRAAAAVLARASDRPVEELVDALWMLHRRDGRGRLFDTLMTELGIEHDPDLVLACLYAYRTHRPHLTPFDGVADLLVSLDRRGVQMGVVSDGHAAVQRRKLVALAGLAGRFSAVVMTDELGPGHSKPSPDGFRLACGVLGVQPDDAVYVANDARKDFRGARTAGLATIRFGLQPDEGGDVDRPPTSAEYSDFTADSIDDLAGLLFTPTGRAATEVPAG